MIRKFLAVLTLLGSVSVPTFAQTVQSQIRAGTASLADGQYSTPRADKSAAAVVTAAHGTYQEAAYRGNIFTLAATSTTASFTVVAGNAAQGALGTINLPLGFYNPTSSGKAAVIIGVKTALISGTPGGPFIYNYYCGLNITSVGQGIIRSGILNNNPAPSAMTSQNNVVLTATPAATPNALTYGPVGGLAAIAAGAGLGSTQEDVQGQIIVPPGCAFGLAATATGSSHVAALSLTWEEIPYP